MRIGVEEIHGTSVPVTWCLNKEEVKKLTETGKEGYLLVLVVPEKHDDGDNHSADVKESRYLIPLKQKIDYLDFFSPGNYTIFATVVWEDLLNFRGLQKRFLGKEHGRYFNCLYRYYGNQLKNDEFDICRFGIHSFEVNVPREVFAKEPPEWEKKWVNLFWGEKSPNQCHYRKKRIFAYSFQLIFFIPILASIELATNLIISAFLLFGTKGIGFRKILHPFSESFDSIWDEINGSIFGKRLIPRLLPSIFVGSSVISWAACKILGVHLVIGTTSLLKAVIMGGVATGVMVVVPGIIYLSYYGVVKVIDKIRNALVPGAEERKRQKELLAETVEKERDRKFRERIEAEYAFLVCNGNLSANMRTLPFKKRIIYLRYKDLKSRWCKSFAR